MNINNFWKQNLCILDTDITIISQNMRSIYKNFQDLHTSLIQFKPAIDIIVLTECRLDPNKSIPRLTNYTSYHTTRHMNSCVGVVIYIKNTHKCSVKEIEMDHASCLEVKLRSFVILGVYRSPSNNNADIFIKSLNFYLIFIKTYKNIVLIGEININITNKINENFYKQPNRLSYLYMLAMHGIFPGHIIPTREFSYFDHFMLKIEKKQSFRSSLL